MTLPRRGDALYSCAWLRVCLREARQAGRASALDLVLGGAGRGGLRRELEIVGVGEVSGSGRKNLDVDHVIVLDVEFTGRIVAANAPAVEEEAKRGHVDTRSLRVPGVAGAVGARGSGGGRSALVGTTRRNRRRFDPARSNITCAQGEHHRRPRSSGVSRRR